MGWLFALLMLMGVVLIIYVQMRADRQFQERKMKIVREKLERMEERKRHNKIREKNKLEDSPETGEENGS